MKTLIIIDVQNDFMSGGSLAASHAEPIVPIINQLQLKVDLIVATQDWHPAMHQSFAATHPGKQAFDSITRNGIKQILWPEHCVQGTVGADFYPTLDTNHCSAIFGTTSMKQEILRLRM